MSRASAIQRAGRAGRTRPGRCLRLYTAHDFAERPEHETPEILRADLTEAALELHAAGVGDLAGFEWFEAPPARALGAAEELLDRLGALSPEARVTALGERMLRLPLHPRLARLVVEAETRGVAEEACTVAALVSERDIRARDVMSGAQDGARKGATTEGPSDLLELLDLFEEAARSDFAANKLRSLNLNPNAVRRVESARRQIRRQLGGGKKSADTPADRETELLISILSGYPDRVARRRTRSDRKGGAGAELLLAGGGSATLAPESVVRRAEFLVAVEVEERRESDARHSTRTSGAHVMLASTIEPEWLLDLFAERISETIEVEWNARDERVETITRLLYDNLVLDESRADGGGGEEATRALARAALAAGIDAFVERAPLDNFLARVEFVSETFPEARLPTLGEDDVTAALEAMCVGRRSFAELRAAARRESLLDALRQKFSREQARLLATAAPERVTLARGRQVRVNYERGKSPWIASRLQDFLGMKDGPQVGGGRVPLVLHLLAPNGRPVQVTTDLTGFWQRHYPQVRRELSRRYPRHAWPEDPLRPDK